MSDGRPVYQLMAPRRSFHAAVQAQRKQQASRGEASPAALRIYGESRRRLVNHGALAAAFDAHSSALSTARRTTLSSRS